jgi:hypothetical protein
VRISRSGRRFPPRRASLDRRISRRGRCGEQPPAGLAEYLPVGEDPLPPLTAISRERDEAGSREPLLAAHLGFQMMYRVRDQGHGGYEDHAKNDRVRDAGARRAQRWDR